MRCFRSTRLVCVCDHVLVHRVSGYGYESGRVVPRGWFPLFRP
jgi:hypothetical protein